MFEGHFASYRKSVNSDFLPGCPEYSKDLVVGGSSAYQILSESLSMAKAYSETGNDSEYFKHLNAHREGMLFLFRTMAGEARNKASSVFEVIHSRGWKWFKFLSEEIDATIVYPDGKAHIRIVPIFYEECSGRVLFDAGEMQVLSAVGSGADAVKSKGPGAEVISIGGKPYLTSRRINTRTEVVDWSRSLEDRA